MQLRRIEELEEGMRGEQGRWERKLVECVEMGKGKIC